MDVPQSFHLCQLDGYLLGLPASVDSNWTGLGTGLRLKMIDSILLIKIIN